VDHNVAVGAGAVLLEAESFDLLGHGVQSERVGFVS